jgi:hypothetical protein
VTAPAHKVPTLPGPYSVAEAITRFLVVATSQLKYHEGKSSNGSWNNDTTFGAWFKLNFNAWCHMFVSWCASVAGYLSIIPKTAYTPSGFNYFKAQGCVGGRVPPNVKGRAATGLGKPKRGDIMYVYSASMGRIHHVGIVENVLPSGYISTIEGNTNLSGSAQGDGVYRLKRKITSSLFFATPNYAAVVKARPKPPTPAKPTSPPKATPTKDGYPLTGGNPKTDSAGKQLLSLAELVAAAENPHTPQYAGYAMTAAAVRSLIAMKMLPAKTTPTGPHFKYGWKKWQISLGYRGKDADGIPGTASFSRFIERTGRSRKSPGYKA